jgi:hypothetical protein
MGMLADKGFQILPESARHYFSEEIAKGRSVDEIRGDGSALLLRLSWRGSFSARSA